MIDPGLLFIESCGLILVIWLPLVGLTFLFGFLAIKNNWSLKLALGIPLSITMFAIFFILWTMMEYDIIILVLGTTLALASLFSYYSFPPVIIDNLNLLFTKLARIKTKEEQI
jgi:hypothetical protein